MHSSKGLSRDYSEIQGSLLCGCDIVSFHLNASRSYFVHYNDSIDIRADTNVF